MLFLPHLLLISLDGKPFATLLADYGVHQDVMGSAAVLMHVTGPFKFTSVVLYGDCAHVRGCCHGTLRCADFVAAPHSQPARDRLSPCRSTLPSLFPLLHHWSWQQSRIRVISRFRGR